MHFIAIDPAAQCGIVHFTDSGDITTYTCDLLSVKPLLASLIVPGDKYTIYIEKPPSGLHGAACVRFAGKLIEDWLRSEYPRKMTFKHVNPNVWQAVARKQLGLDRTTDTKEVARLICDRHQIGYDSQDAADAVAMLITQLSS